MLYTILALIINQERFRFSDQSICALVSQITWNE